jgi:hypothetical protein
MSTSMNVNEAESPQYRTRAYVPGVSTGLLIAVSVTLYTIGMIHLSSPLSTGDMTYLAQFFDPLP